jgi:hypothetical protein
MEPQVLEIVGKIAGIGGLSVGVFLLLFRDVIRKKIFAQLTKEQSYNLLKWVLILTWSLAIVGIGAMMYSQSVIDSQVHNNSGKERQKSEQNDFFQKRVFYTAKVDSDSEDNITQVFSMKSDGTDVQQHTTSPSIKHSIYNCYGSNTVFFNSDDSISYLDQNLKERTLLSKNNTEYSQFNCSGDGRYYSVLSFDKVTEAAEIELYDSESITKMYSWNGDDSSWMRTRNIIVYRVAKFQEGGSGKIELFARDIDLAPEKPEKIFNIDVGEYVYDIREPLIVGLTPRDIVFRVYDEHEYFYYFRKLGKSFAVTDHGLKLEHTNIYADDVGEDLVHLEQGQLTMSPNGKHLVMNAHPWNTPPALYLLDITNRNAWKFAEGFNPVWSADSKRIFFNKDPEHYRTAHEHEKVFPATLNGYEIYSYDLENNLEIRLTRDDKYQGFL